jgi:hypothetical protein
MMIGFVVLAVMTGLVTGVGAMVMGHGVLAAMGIYAGTGVLVLMGLIAQAMVETLQDGRETAMEGGVTASSRAGRRP